MKRTVAVIDLGTNTFHLMVARLDQKLTILHREKQPVKLGQGGINYGSITPEAMERALRCMKQFKAIMEEFRVSEVRALGTSALRSASNRLEVLKQIKDTCGITVDIISGDDEATYIYHGVRWATQLGNETSLIVDIGGGSVEFIIANQEKVFWKESFDIGAQRLLEKFQKHDPITGDEILQLEQFLDSKLLSLKDAMAIYPVSTLVGSSGTFDTLSEIYCSRNALPYAETPETPLTMEGMLEIHKELISKDRMGRMKIPGMIEMRVDMIVVASCLIQYLVKLYHFNRVRVSTYSLKEGVIAKEFLSS